MTFVLLSGNFKHFSSSLETLVILMCLREKNRQEIILETMDSY